jgi:hypothetical protein
VTVRLPRRNDSAHAGVRPPRSWWVSSVSDRGFIPAVNACGACTLESTSRGSINLTEEGEAGFYLSHLAFAALASRASALEPCSLSCRRTTLAPCCSSTDPHGSSPAHHHRQPASVAALDGDDALSERAGDRWPARGERRWTSRGMDRTAPERAGAQPAVRLRRQLHPLPRAGLRARRQAASCVCCAITTAWSCTTSR